jgi:hypothetical protein
MMATQIKFRCYRASSKETRIFDTLDEAYRFVMREGDHNRLWTLEAI